MSDASLNEKSGIRQETVLFISFSDQHDWGLNRMNQLRLNCTTDVDENWRPLLGRYFKNLLCYDMAKNANAAGLIAANAELLEMVRIYRPALVFYPCLFDGLVTLESLSVIRTLGSRIVGLFFDDDLYFERYTKYMLPYLDYFVTASPYAAEKYSIFGVEAIPAVPIPMDTAIFRKLDETVPVYDVTFVGNPHVADRQLLLDEFRAANVEVKTFGGTGSQSKIHYSTMVKIFNQSRINLHFSKNVTADGRLVPQLKGRIFEVTLSGGFLLCEYFPGIEDFFIPEKEIICFENIDDAAAKIKYFLKHEDKRNEIAENGYRKAVASYSGELTIGKIFARINSIRPADRKQLPAELTVLPNDLSKLYSENYCRWIRSLVRADYPLRSQWRQTTELALAMYRDNRYAANILWKNGIIGDPQGAAGLYKNFKWYCRRNGSRWYYGFRSKLRRLKRKIRS